MDDVILETRGLTKHYGGLHALQDGMGNEVLFVRTAIHLMMQCFQVSLRPEVDE
jgi:hypothetical protein